MTFTMWSALHYFMMIMPVVFAVVLFLVSKNKTKEQKLKLGTILSAVMIVMLVLRNVEYIVVGKKMTPELIPLQICHFANFVLLYAFLKDSKASFLIAFAFNLPAAYMSLVFANGLEGYETILNFRGFAYIFGHIGIAALALWGFLENLITSNKRDFFRGAIILTILFFISIPINSLNDKLMPDYTSNYFYSITPEAGTPLEMFYSWGNPKVILGMNINAVYILFTLLLGMAVYSSLTGVVYLYSKRKKSL